MQDDKIMMGVAETGEPEMSRMPGVKEFAVVKRSVAVGGHKTSVEPRRCILD